MKPKTERRNRRSVCYELAQQGTNSDEDQITNRQYDSDLYQEDRQSDEQPYDSKRDSHQLEQHRGNNHKNK